MCDERALAWDCATGNGQAAISTAGYFERVIATDASAEQIASAPSHANVSFRVAPAESSGLANASIDLITVAQALHWFDIEAFFNEANRVLKPNGVLAVWSYEHCQVGPRCNELIMKIFAAVEDYWPPERELVLSHYAQIEFPMGKVDIGQFAMTANWSAQQILGYMGTWSATQRYIRANVADPMPLFAKDLRAVWGQKSRKVSWPLTLMVRRK